MEKEKCPFCGNKYEEEFSIYSENRILTPDHMYRVYKVACSCGAMGKDSYSPEDAVVQWNRRA